MTGPLIDALILRKLFLHCFSSKHLLKMSCFSLSFKIRNESFGGCESNLRASLAWWVFWNTHEIKRFSSWRALGGWWRWCRPNLRSKEMNIGLVLIMSAEAQLLSNVTVWDISHTFSSWLCICRLTHIKCQADKYSNTGYPNPNSYYFQYWLIYQYVLSVH